MNGPGCVKVASVAGFYAWLQEPVSDHAKEDARLLDLIRDSYSASHGVYGARRIFGDLREVGEVCGLHRVDLAVVVDLFARKVVGWSMKPSLSRELAMDALLMAVWRRKPAGRVVVHPDQGSQYGSDDFKRFCQAKKPRTQHEPTCQLLGQCSRRVILFELEEGAHSKARLQNL